MKHLLAALAENKYGPDQQAIGELETFCDRYPYCQPAQMLLSVARKKHGQDPDGTTEKRAMTYAIDRQVFMTHLERQVAASEPGETSGGLPAFDELPLVINPAYEALSLPDNDHRHAGDERYISPEKLFSEKQRKQHEIIDRFLATDPRIMPRAAADAENNPEPELHAPGNYPAGQQVHSLVTGTQQDASPQEPAASGLPEAHHHDGTDQDEPEEEAGEINETVASLLIKFGKTDKALRIYEKLCLKYPEKSSYFAKKISDLHLGLRKNTTG